APPPNRPFVPGCSAAARLLIDVRPPRHENVEFPSNPFFNDLCGQIVREEAILLAGAPGSNKSTLARQLTLDLVSTDRRALMILTEESAERAKACFLTMASEWPHMVAREPELAILISEKYDFITTILEGASLSVKQRTI